MGHGWHWEGRSSYCDWDQSCDLCEIVELFFLVEGLGGRMLGTESMRCIRVYGRCECDVLKTPSRRFLSCRLFNTKTADVPFPHYSGSPAMHGTAKTDAEILEIAKTASFELETVKATIELKQISVGLF